ncbi:MAG: hypothetical protein PVJ71_02700 [Lysobacterales bacterium]|jgi:hypothetical protein
MFNKVFYTLLTVIALFATNANGAPLAYSVNSDGQNEATWDSLYLIDLGASGSEQRMGPLFSMSNNFFDTEGLAFDTNGMLWGVDDDSRILFPITNPQSPTINALDVITLPAFPTGGGNDFGMTFTCDGSLYVTSVVNQTLYRVNMNGYSQVIGGLGALGADISAIAATGNPAKLYGLGLGNVTAPALYSIDTQTGAATEVGPLLNAMPYHEAGLAFDANGGLWAITDRSGLNNQPSQVLMINTSTGEATPASMTVETGFESLAISAPTNCAASDVDTESDYPAIPALNRIGHLVTGICLALIGLVTLRRRVF